MFFQTFCVVNLLKKTHNLDFLESQLVLLETFVKQVSEINLNFRYQQVKNQKKNKAGLLHSLKGAILEWEGKFQCN